MIQFVTGNSPRFANGFALCATAVLGLSACNPRTQEGEPAAALEPQLLSINFMLVTLDVSDTLDALNDGTSEVSDLLGNAPCNATPSFRRAVDAEEEPIPVPELRLSGEPGDVNFSLNLNFANPVMTDTDQPEACADITEFVMVLGELDGTVSLGETTSAGNVTVLLADGREFEESEFIEAELDTYSADTEYTSGRFRFANRLPDTDQLLLGEGSFSLTP